MESNDYSLLLEFLNRDSFQSIQKSQFLSLLDKKHSEYRKYSSKIYDELQVLVEENPQLVLDLTNEFLESKESLTKLINISYKTKGKKLEDEKDLSEKMTNIAGLYEVSSLFSLTAYILSEGELKVDHLHNPYPQAVLKRLNTLGLSKEDREDIRIIRNAESHKFNLGSKSIYYDGKEIMLSRIDELYLLLNDLMNWNLSIYIYAFFLMPKFGMLVSVSIYLQYMKYGEEWNEFYDGILSYYKSFFEEYKKKEGQRTTEKKASIKPSIQSKVKKESRKQNSIEFFVENYEIIFNRLSYHANSITDMLHELHDKIQSHDEKQVITKVELWMRKNGDDLKGFIEKIKNNPRFIGKKMKNKGND